MLTQIDIDELLNRCRTENSRSYLKEAIDCYRINAYRACVICTWIAVVYDIIDKLRELALTGDTKAIAHVKIFDEIQKKRDTDAALKFEREVLGIAKNEFEFVSAQEHADLTRLLEDRNRSGHPNLSRDYIAYSPPPELARLHLRTAVEHLLGRPPAQGETAIKLLFETIDSDYFPIEPDKAKIILSESPLVRAKSGLIDGFLKGAFLSLAREELTEKKQRQRLAAIDAVRKIHPINTQVFLEKEFTKLIAKSKDICFPKIVWLLVQIPETQGLLDDIQKTRLKIYAETIPDEQIHILQYALNIDFLKEQALGRMKKCTEPNYYAIVAKLAINPGPAFIDQCIEFYRSANGFHHANTLAPALITPTMQFMSRDQLKKIVTACVNNQVLSSFSYLPLLLEIVQKGMLDRTTVAAFLTECGHADIVERVQCSSQ